MVSGTDTRSRTLPVKVLPSSAVSSCNVAFARDSRCVCSSLQILFNAFATEHSAPSNFAMSVCPCVSPHTTPREQPEWISLNFKLGSFSSVCRHFNFG
jgi:hypothetical protein